MAVPIVALMASHVACRKRLGMMQECLESWRIQEGERPRMVVLVSTAPELAAEVVALLLDYRAKTGALEFRYSSERRSQFEHYKDYCELQRSQTADQWVMFTDDDDLWHPHRGLIYRQLVADAVQLECTVVSYPWMLVAGSSAEVSTKSDSKPSAGSGEHSGGAAEDGAKQSDSVPPTSMGDRSGGAAEDATNQSNSEPSTRISEHSGSAAEDVTDETTKEGDSAPPTIISEHSGGAAEDATKQSDSAPPTSTGERSGGAAEDATAAPDRCPPSKKRARPRTSASEPSDLVSAPEDGLPYGLATADGPSPYSFKPPARYERRRETTTLVGGATWCRRDQKSTEGCDQKGRAWLAARVAQAGAQPSHSMHDYVRLALPLRLLTEFVDRSTHALLANKYADVAFTAWCVDRAGLRYLEPPLGAWHQWAYCYRLHPGSAITRDDAVPDTLSFNLEAALLLTALSGGRVAPDVSRHAPDDGGRALVRLALIRMLVEGLRGVPWSYEDFHKRSFGEASWGHTESAAAAVAYPLLVHEYFLALGDRWRPPVEAETHLRPRVRSWPWAQN